MTHQLAIKPTCALFSSHFARPRPSLSSLRDYGWSPDPASLPRNPLHLPNLFEAPLSPSPSESLRRFVQDDNPSLRVVPSIQRTKQKVGRRPWFDMVFTTVWRVGPAMPDPQSAWRQAPRKKQGSYLWAGNKADTNDTLGPSASDPLGVAYREMDLEPVAQGASPTVATKAFPVQCGRKGRNAIISPAVRYTTCPWNCSYRLRIGWGPSRSYRCKECVANFGLASVRAAHSSSTNSPVKGTWGRSLCCSITIANSPCNKSTKRGVSHFGLSFPDWPAQGVEQRIRRASFLPNSSDYHHRRAFAKVWRATFECATISRFQHSACWPVLAIFGTARLSATTTYDLGTLGLR